MFANFRSTSTVRNLTGIIVTVALLLLSIVGIGFAVSGGASVVRSAAALAPAPTGVDASADATVVDDEISVRVSPRT